MNASGRFVEAGSGIIAGSAALPCEPNKGPMARIFVSGSSTGLGLMAGQLLAEQGHQVILHARNARRADATRRALAAATVVVGDLETVAGAKDVAAQVNALGSYDAVIHNAAVGYQEEHRVTPDGVPHVFAVNTLSAYVLTALIEKPRRLVYLSSGLHHSASANLRRHPLPQAALERHGGLLREQVARYVAGLRHGAPVARGAVQCAGAGLGRDPHGRPGRD